MTCTLSISKSKIQNNLSKIHSKLPDECRILSVIKANAYGLGAKEIGPILVEGGINYLAVATPLEALTLREICPDTPILLLQEPDNPHVESLLNQNITFTVYTFPFIQFLAELTIPIKVHLKIDTGMTRLGCHIDEAIELSALLSKSPQIHFEGIYSHFAQSEIPSSSYNETQTKSFDSLLPSVRPLLDMPGSIHMANSAAAHSNPNSFYDMVRIGVSLYDDALTLTSSVRHIRFAPKGTRVSYESLYTTPSDTTICVVDAGYTDGIPSSYQNGVVLINGDSYPIVGQICMDMLMVDLQKSSADICLGDPVTLMSGHSCVTLQDISKKSGFNPREIMIHMGQSSRVRKEFIA